MLEQKVQVLEIKNDLLEGQLEEKTDDTQLASLLDRIITIEDAMAGGRQVVLEQEARAENIKEDLSTLMENFQDLQKAINESATLQATGSKSIISKN